MTRIVKFVEDNGKEIRLMKVYVIITNWQFDSGECGTHCEGVFMNEEDALKCYNACVIDARVDMNGMDVEEDDFDENILKSWSIWESEEYCYNHIDIVVEEKEIK